MRHVADSRLRMTPTNLVLLAIHHVEDSSAHISRVFLHVQVEEHVTCLQTRTFHWRMPATLAVPRARQLRSSAGVVHKTSNTWRTRPAEMGSLNERRVHEGAPPFHFVRAIKVL